MNLDLKFKDSSSQSERRRILDKLVSGGARKVDPVFPDAPEESLRSLYVVDAGDNPELLGVLEDEDAVETAEPSARRGLA